MILAIISLSLAIVNLFPFLPLDGGHIFWAIVEKVRGKPVPFSVMERAGVVGFMLVIVFFLVGLTNDIDRLSGEGFQSGGLSAEGGRPWRRTAESRTEKPAGLDANTMGEAFQKTAQAHPDRLALRTRGDEFTLTWGEYAERVRALAAGLAALGSARRHDRDHAHQPARVPLLRLRRDAPRRHAFSIYNTYSPEQIEYLVGDAERASGHGAGVPRPRTGKQRARALSWSTATSREAHDARRAPRGTPVRLRGRLARGRTRRRLTLIYTSGTTGPPKGVQITQRQDGGRSAPSTR